MNSREIYKRYLLKANKNDSNDGVNTLISHFVLMFNSENIRWLGDALKKDGDNIKLSHLDTMLEPNVELTLVKKFDDSVEFKLPDNFYRHSSSYSLVDRGTCKNVKILNFEKKPLGFNTILGDDFSRPQFDFEETPFIITHNKLKVYFDDFEIKKVFATYYRIPTVIDIAGYAHIDGNPSTDIDSDLPLDSIDEILDRMVLETAREVKDGEGFQFTKERITTEP